jgi:hypothetical protein
MCAGLVAVLAVAGALPAAAAPPTPSATRALFGGPLNLYNREAQLGRNLDVVRIYTKWGPNGPVANVASLKPLVTAGTRTLLISASLPWADWRSEAATRNGDGNAANDVPYPYCAAPPMQPGTTTPSGKSWFAAVGDGDYDAQVTTWLAQINDQLGAGVESIYVSLQHEPDRLSDDQSAVDYQRCAGTPAEYRAASARVFDLANGAGGRPNRWAGAGQGGKLRFVVIFTTWGFWHTAGGAGQTSRSLVNLGTGLPPAGATGADATLASARITPWAPAADKYDYLATDVFNYSGAAAGSTGPNGVRVDDPATTAKESDLWRSLPNLLASVKLWTTNHTSDIGAARPKRVFVTELGSVPDPHRPQRKAQWIGEACRWFSDPANSMFEAALYFDVNQMRLKTWTWTKRNGAWFSSTPKADDTPSINALGAMSRSARFSPGGGACPTG